MPDEKSTNEYNDVIFSVYGALDNLNKRLKSVEEKVPDYTADMLEVYRNFGVLTKRLSELEDKVEKLTVKKPADNKTFKHCNTADENTQDELALEHHGIGKKRKREP